MTDVNRLRADLAYERERRDHWYQEWKKAKEERDEYATLLEDGIEALLAITAAMASANDWIEDLETVLRQITKAERLTQAKFFAKGALGEDA